MYTQTPCFGMIIFIVNLSSMKLQYCETGILYNATRIFSINTARIVKIYGMSYIINDAFFEKKIFL